ncbi:MAG: hypothetical protein WCR52_12885 [Bacteroidota bacterium]
MFRASRSSGRGGTGGAGYDPAHLVCFGHRGRAGAGASAARAVTRRTWFALGIEVERARGIGGAGNDPAHLVCFGHRGRAGAGTGGAAKYPIFKLSVSTYIFCPLL